MSWTDVAKRAIPDRYGRHATHLWRAVRSIPYRGRSRTCPICGTGYRRFGPVGNETAATRRMETVSIGRRRDALCHMCGAKERQRLLWLYLVSELDVFAGNTRMLQFAPNDGFRSQIAGHPNVEYYATNIRPVDIDVRSDITALPFDAGVFDLVVCNHVLEHITDDHDAMREVRRVLETDGVAIVMVPSATRWRTIEDPDMESAERREAMFGQADHVRLYGRDISRRLSDAGFVVDAVDYPTRLGERLTTKYGLLPNEFIYHCTVPN